MSAAVSGAEWEKQIFYYFFPSLPAGGILQILQSDWFLERAVFYDFAANLGGIVGSFIHKFVCCLWMSKNRHFQTIFLLKLALLLALTGKSEFYYSDKISEGRIKQVSEENR